MKKQSAHWKATQKHAKGTVRRKALGMALCAMLTASAVLSGFGGALTDGAVGIGKTTVYAKAIGKKNLQGPNSEVTLVAQWEKLPPASTPTKKAVPTAAEKAVSSARTGDEFNPVIWITLLAAGVALLLIILAVVRRRRK